MNNLMRSLTPEYPEQVAKLKASFSFLQRFSDAEVALMWERFSSDACAGWLGVDETWMKRFKDWLEE